MQAYSVPWWWVGWWLWRAGCISQDTYLLYVVRYVGIELLWQVKTSLPETLLDEGLGGQFKNTLCTTLCHRKGTLNAWQLSLLSEQTSALSTLEDRLLLDNCCHLDFFVFFWMEFSEAEYVF